MRRCVGTLQQIVFYNSCPPVHVMLLYPYWSGYHGFMMSQHHEYAEDEPFSGPSGNDLPTRGSAISPASALLDKLGDLTPVCPDRKPRGR